MQRVLVTGGARRRTSFRGAVRRFTPYGAASYGAGAALYGAGRAARRASASYNAGTARRFKAPYDTVKISLRGASHGAYRRTTPAELLTPGVHRSYE